MSPKLVQFVVLSAAVVLLDQASKLWVVAHVEQGSGFIEVIPGFFHIVHVQNAGAAGGLLGDYTHRMWVFLAFTLVAVGVLVSMVRELPRNERVMSTALALIMGGAIGNAIDRLHKQSVTDFLRFFTEDPRLTGWLRSTLGVAEYPSFNIADAAIVVGVLGYLILYLLGYGALAEDGERPAAESDP
ncbi:MAG: signal peptidase II [Alphaproteobacteria bacterium]|nr:signal peptidase II [Alphaproteobacteria bacterium]